jgi:hypothetical protein
VTTVGPVGLTPLAVNASKETEVGTRCRRTVTTGDTKGPILLLVKANSAFTATPGVRIVSLFRVHHYWGCSLWASQVSVGESGSEHLSTDCVAQHRAETAGPLSSRAWRFSFPTAATTHPGDPAFSLRLALGRTACPDRAAEAEFDADEFSKPSSRRRGPC